MPVADLIRKLGISEQTFCRWKKQYAGTVSRQYDNRFDKLTQEISPEGQVDLGYDNARAALELPGLWPGPVCRAMDKRTPPRPEGFIGAL